MMDSLKENEVINDLLGYDGLKIIQNTKMFNFSLDSTLLANFLTINKKINKIVDLGTGNAPIPLFLSLRTNVPIVGVEIQEEVFDMAKRNVLLNDLESQISLYNEDLKGVNKIIGNHKFDAVTCNPPFFKVNRDSNINKNDYLTIARHEVKVTLEEVIIEANKLLKNGGYFAMVHRPDRLVDIFSLMRKNKIEPKRLRMVHPSRGKEANTVLIEGRKTTEGGLKVLPPLYVHDEDHTYSEEVRRMFMLR